MAIATPRLLVLPWLYPTLGRRWGYEFKPAFFVTVMLAGTINSAICLWLAPHVATAFLANFLPTPFGAAYYFRAKIALPLIAFVGLTISAMGFVVEGPFTGARTAYLVLVAVGGALMLLPIMRILIRTVANNRALSELD